MTEPSHAAGPTIVPYFGYRDVEMALGGAVVIIGTGEPPSEGDAAATSPTGHGIYVVVEDVDAHHERAKAAGARIVYGSSTL